MTLRTINAADKSVDTPPPLHGLAVQTAGFWLAASRGRSGEGGYGIVLKICEGARITGNKAVLEGDAGEGGGAIVARKHALLEVSGGEISGNYSDLSGGAVQLFSDGAAAVAVARELAANPFMR